MALQASVNTYTITNAGGTKIYDLTEITFGCLIYADSGAVTIGADMNFTVSGTPSKNLMFLIAYNGGVTSDTGGGKSVNFFGTQLSNEQALSPCLIIATYNETTSSWDVTVCPSFTSTAAFLNGEYLKSLSIPNSALMNTSIELAKLKQLTAQGYMLRGGVAGSVEDFDASGNAKLILGDGTTVNSVSMSGDATITNAGVITVSANAITTSKITNNSVTVDKVSSSLKYDVINTTVSFEAGEQTTYKIYIPYSCTVTLIYAEVVKAIAATDDATITPKNNAGTNMTDGLITFTASSALTTAVTVTPSADNTFVSGDFLQLLTAKTTAGGKAYLSIIVLKS